MVNKTAEPILKCLMFELNVVAFVQDCLCVCVLEFNTLVLDTTVTQVGERMPLYRKCHDAHVDIA